MIHVLRSVLIVCGVGLCYQACVSRASAAEVTPELVCTVQAAIRWDHPRWSPQRCAAVAAATNADEDPAGLLAVQVLESGLRSASIAWHRIERRDEAHPGRKATGARTWTSSAGVSRHVADVGLGGVRCVLEHGRCTNWPVRGLTPARLMEPVVNVRVAAKVLAWKRRTCGARAHDCYVGNPSGSKGRTRHVLAIVAAFSGELVPLKARRDRRAAALARKIAAAVRQMPREKS